MYIERIEKNKEKSQLNLIILIAKGLLQTSSLVQTVNL